MKTITLIIAVLYVVNSAAQINDLDLANALIGTKHKHMEDTLDKYEVDYYLVQKSGNIYTYFISNGKDALKMWDFTISQLETSGVGHNAENMKLGDPLVVKFFIRYSHVNYGHLRDFHIYEQPNNTKYITYEKSLGKKLSHFSGTMDTFRERK